jgi:hypothetical protein
MKKFIDVLFYISVGLIPTGMIFRISDLTGGNTFIALGLLGLFIYFIAKTIKDYVEKRTDRTIIPLLLLIILMSIILFAKYLYWTFGDYPGLLIVPLFVFDSLFFLILMQKKRKDLKLTIAVVLYLIMVIPLFGLEFYKSPRQYLPTEWYNRYTVSESVPVKIPFEFERKETKELSAKGLQFSKSKLYFDAIPFYRAAIKIEPKNPGIYFDLSNCYAFTNDLEHAITLLDTAIILNNQFAPFYNNRGLLYYKLKQNDKAINDYEYAIKLDSTNMTFYFNLALALYYQKRYNEACQALDKAEHLGFNNGDRMIKQIRKKCKDPVPVYPHYKFRFPIKP